MKAYLLSIKDEDDAGMQVVFADTASKAKKLVHGDLWDQLDNYLDLRVHRDKRYDGMEDLSEAELALRQWRDGWRWFDMDYPDPDTATDEEFLNWYKSTFAREDTPNA